MAAITVALVKELRERTGVGVMECKKALIEEHGDIELAINYMRRSGQAKAAKKAARLAVEGMIQTNITQEGQGKYGVIIEINCETDFVARDSNFKDFGKKVITTALNKRIMDIELLKKQFEEQRILLVAKMGENVNIRRLSILQGNILGSYLHGSRIGVIVSADGAADEEFIKYIAMHIAASKPEYVNADDIPAELIKREHQIQLGIAMQSGKPLEIAEKIVAGRMQKFLDKISLTRQHFVIDPSKTVAQLLIEHHANIKSFIRFEVGEGVGEECIG